MLLLRDSNLLLPRKQLRYSNTAATEGLPPPGASTETVLHKPQIVAEEPMATQRGCLQPRSAAYAVDPS